MTFQNTNENFIKNMLLKVWFQDGKDLPVLIEQTLWVFENWMQGEILSALSEDSMEKFDILVSKNSSDEEIYDFFNKNIQNFDVFMDSLYNRFEKKYISEYKKSLNK